MKQDNGIVFLWSCTVINTKTTFVDTKGKLSDRESITLVFFGKMDLKMAFQFGWTCLRVSSRCVCFAVFFLVFFCIHSHITVRAFLI